MLTRDIFFGMNMLSLAGFVACATASAAALPPPFSATACRQARRCRSTSIRQTAFGCQQRPIGPLS